MSHWARMMLTAVSLCCALAHADQRVKDLADVSGVRDNPLLGYGLVVGLPGTGDQTTQTPFTVQSIRSMLSRFGVRIPDDVNPQLKNVAAVTVHGTLPAFAKPGQRLDVTVSSLGNATSLRGGTLLMAPLLGPDGQVYALAQGSLLVGGLSAGGQDGSRITVNIPSAGRIPAGATVEREAPSVIAGDGSLTLNLRRADFTTATRLTEVINERFGASTARARDGGTVDVMAPADPSTRIAFLSMLENLTVEPGEQTARVVVNARTGTIVMGGNVRIQPAAVSHGSLTVAIRENPQVSQPNPFGAGQTVVTPQSDVDVGESGSRMFKLDTGVSLDELVAAINQVGAAPSDLVAILEALSQAGALRAELVVL